MGKKLRHILTLSVFVAALGGFFILNRAVRTPDTLEAERRQPAAFPRLTAQTLLSGDFMRGFEDFAADSFAFRDGFRSIRAFTVLEVFRQSDKSGLYRDALVGAGKLAPVAESEVRRTAGKLATLAAALGEMNVYVSVIPDKSAYAGREYPGFDIEMSRRILEEALPDARYIDITAALDAGSYYKTDLHWDQSTLEAAVAALGDEMGFLDSASDGASMFERHTAGEFYGVYKGQLALPMPPDTMIYLTSAITENAVTRYLDDKTLEWTAGEIYDLEAFAGRDPYDIFLRGAQALITMENPEAETARELYLFRDSFSSSLAPLLLPHYAKITLIDLRYVDFRVLPSLIELSPNADALFLYSSQILGAPDILKIG